MKSTGEKLYFHLKPSLQYIFSDFMAAAPPVGASASIVLWMWIQDPGNSGALVAVESQDSGRDPDALTNRRHSECFTQTRKAIESFDWSANRKPTDGVPAFVATIACGRNMVGWVIATIVPRSPGEEGVPSGAKVASISEAASSKLARTLEAALSEKLPGGYAASAAFRYSRAA